MQRWIACGGANAGQRERDKGFREETFLAKFHGVAPADADNFADPAGDPGSIGTRAVTLGVRKALIEFDELVLKKPAPTKEAAPATARGGG
jgi:hypothetical protein